MTTSVPAGPRAVALRPSARPMTTRRPRRAPTSPGSPASPASRVVAVVIPAMNEEATIGRVVAAVPRRLDGVAEVVVLVVDDGSRDATQARAVAAGADAIVSHRRNRGLAEVFRRGVQEALRRGADIVVQLDGDGQHDPAEIRRLIQPIMSGEADVVLGARPLADSSCSDSRVRRYGNRLGSFCLRRMAGLSVTDATSGYRAFSREALMRMSTTGEFTYTLESLIEARHQALVITEVPISVAARTAGESRMTAKIGRYVRRAGVGAVRALAQRRPLCALGAAAAAAAMLAVPFGVRIGVDAITGTALHIPSLIAAMGLALGSVVFLAAGIVADAVSANRRLTEQALTMLRALEHDRLAQDPSRSGPPAWDPDLFLADSR